jgi:hypothetical protein
VADKDELDVSGSMPSLPPDIETEEGVAAEPLIIPDEPLEVLQTENLDARNAYRESLYDDRRRYYEDETEAESLEAINKTMDGRDFVVGDKPGFGGRWVGAASGGGTIDAYRVHEDINIKNQGKHILRRLPDLFRAVDERTLATQAGLIEAGLLNTDGTPKSDLTQDERDTLEHVTIGLTGAGAVGLGLLGSRAGIPGLLIGSLSGLGMGAGLGVAYGTYRETMGELSALDVAGDLVSKTYNVLGNPDDIHHALLNFSDEHRETAISSIVALGDALGLDEVPKFMGRHGIIDTDDYVSKLQEAAKTMGELEEGLEKRERSGIERLPGAPTATDLYMDFMSGVFEIAARIASDDTYRELRAKEWEKSIAPKSVERSVESRAQKPTDNDWAGLRIYERIEDEPELSATKDAYINRWLDGSSYDSLPPPLQKKAPSAAKFKKIVQEKIAANDPGMNFDDKHNLVAAIEAVHLGKSNKDIQAILNRVSIQAFRLPIFEDMNKSFIPSVGEVDSWAEKLLAKQNRLGRRSTKVAERVASEIFTNPIEHPELGTLYKASTIGQILNWANLVPTLWAELDPAEPLKFMGVSDVEVTLPVVKTMAEVVDYQDSASGTVGSYVWGWCPQS